MRSLDFLSSFIILFCLATAQNFGGNRPFNNFQGSQSGNRPSTSTSTGIQEGCFCLIASQPCPPGSSSISTRIVNTRPRDVCPVADILCCNDGVEPILGAPVPTTVTSGCGSRSQHVLFEGNLAKSEADFGEYPWMAAIVKMRGGAPDYVAGGVLVSETVVLTAAHKLDGISVNDLVVRLGDYDLANSPENEIKPHQAVRVLEIKVFPGANFRNLHNNLALLILAQPARTRHNRSPNIRTACLPVSGQTFGSRTCFLTGWGKNALGRPQNFLREVDLPIVDPLRCEHILRTPLGKNFRLDKSLLCAGGEVGKDACQDDGGSPLVCFESGRWVVVGLVAGGIGCGTEIPGLYVNLAYFAPFIQSYIQ